MTPGGTSGQLLGVDAVREFNVATDTYGATYGKRDGAQVSIVTTSGTNHLHGTAFEFIRNSALDARNYFDQGAIPEFQRNQFGGSLGGPIRAQQAFPLWQLRGLPAELGTERRDAGAGQRSAPGLSAQLRRDRSSMSASIAAVAPLLALWPVQNGPELGSGIAEAFSHPAAAYPRRLRHHAF